ncbi:MAG: NYN domain-containing protein [Clostridia bacterium]|nr:NYN domain-containing protein [Clostridia bacterium]
MNELEKKKHTGLINAKFAVLIDADNNSKDYIKVVFDEMTDEGIITYKRMYGDWTSPNLKSMKDVLLEYSITPMQQYSYTKGKNSTDSAMIIDAMDILYTGDVDGFCLVSSDSDFTKLASRLREAGKFVIGMGRQQTPKAFVSACNKFKFVDLINENMAQEAQDKEIPKVEIKNQEEQNSKTPIEEIKKTITKIIEEKSDDEGWVLVSLVGIMLQNKYSDFDSRNYGHKKMTSLLKELDFEIKAFKESDASRKSGQVFYIRLKK